MVTDDDAQLETATMNSQIKKLPWPLRAAIAVPIGILGLGTMWAGYLMVRASKELSGDML